MEAGGRGEVASALTELARIRDSLRRGGPSDIASLAWSTTGSLYRQAGRHADAHIFDGHALAAADLAPTGDRGFAAVGWSPAAAADALVGLAADNLGLGRFGASRRLLDRAERVLGSAVTDPDPPSRDHVGWDPDSWASGGRGLLRLRWVGAELAMYTGDAQTARRSATSAVELAERPGVGPTTRHRVKSGLIAAAALAVSGDVDGAAKGARELAHRAAADDLRPLQWAALSLLDGVGAADTEQRRELGEVRAWLASKGMPFPGAADR